MPALIDVEHRTYEIIHRYFKNAPADLTPVMRLREDLGADSLDLLQILFDIEQELGVSIPDAEAAEIETVGDAVRCASRAAP
jgi:acyl carrier protein